MPRHTIISIAYLKEAKPLIEYFSLKQTDKNLWKRDHLHLVITGLGRVAAGAAMQQHGARNSLFINVGVCGHKNYPIGSLFLAHKVYDNLVTFYPQILHKTTLPSEVLCSVDTPSYDGDTLYDMEASGFFQIALRFSPLEYIHCIKVVSDTSEIPFEPSRIHDLMRKTIPALEELIENIPYLESPPDISEQYELLTAQYHFTETEKHKLRDTLEKKALFEMTTQKLPL